MKTESFENSFGSGAFWNRIVLKTFHFYCRQVRTETFENDDEKSVVYCRFLRRTRKRISVDSWKQNENASVVEDILLRPRWDENGYFKIALVRSGPRVGSFHNICFDWQDYSTQHGDGTLSLCRSLKLRICLSKFYCVCLELLAWFLRGSERGSTISWEIKRFFCLTDRLRSAAKKSPND